MQTRTLQAVTAAHSQRLSALHQRRDRALRDARLARDSELRNLPSARALYTRFDKAVAAALDDRFATEHRAAAARETALARAVDARGASLTAAHLKRRAADLAALDRKTQAETAAEEKFRESVSSLMPTTALDVRQKTSREAERVRQQQVQDANESYVGAMAAAQGAYQEATEEALLGEREAERAAEQAHNAARRTAKASENAAAASAERELLAGLALIADARATLDRYQILVQRIHSEAAAAEHDLFKLFRDELQAAS